jgi:hypothetical protein
MLPSKLSTTGLRQEAFEIILAWEMLGHKDSRQGHHYKFDAGNGHASLHCLFLCILHHHNELGDAIRLHAMLHCICVQGDHLDGMQPPAVGVKESHDVKGRDLCVKCVSVFQVIVPKCHGETWPHPALPPFNWRSPQSGFMCSLRTNANNRHGAIGDPLVKEWETGQVYKFGIVVGFILGGLGEDGHEGVNTVQLVIGDDHEKGDKGLPDGKQVVIRWLPFKGGRGVMSLFEEVGDCVRYHFGCLSVLLGFRSQLGAVEDCNDDIGFNCISKGKLRLLDAFRDLSESVGSRNGNSGFGCLFRVQFKLDSISTRVKKGQHRP